jgi:hypothetical protein
LTLHGATLDLTRLTFSPDGRRLLGFSNAGDGGVWVWDATPSEAKEREDGVSGGQVEQPFGQGREFLAAGAGCRPPDPATL